MGDEQGVSLLWTSSTPAPGVWTLTDEEEFLEGFEDGDPMGWELGWSGDGQGVARRRVGWFETRDCLMAAFEAFDEAWGVARTLPDLLSGFTVVEGVDGTTCERPIPRGRSATLTISRDVTLRFHQGVEHTRLIASVSVDVVPGLGGAVIALAAVMAAFQATQDAHYMGP